MEIVTFFHASSFKIVFQIVEKGRYTVREEEFSYFTSDRSEAL
jgi:hypothetical protein